MKKASSIIFLFIIISLLLLIINKNNQKLVVTKNKINITNQEIYYPKFGITKLDSYIEKYINEILKNNTASSSQELFIDYDYFNTKEKVNINFYTYTSHNNLASQTVTTINYDLVKGKITKETSILKTDYTYDIVNQKIIDSNTKLVAFTFDDGPSHNTAKIVDILKKYNATATFFVLGNKVEKYHKTIKYLNDNNMEIGNHTYTHILLTKLNEEKILKEIEDTQKAIYNQIGKYPYFFRPSYGTVSRKIKKTSPLPLVIWSLDTLDWKYHNSKKITNKILSKVKDGDIILMHDTYTATVNAVREVIPKLKEMDYEIVSVSELFYYKNKEARLGYYYGSL